MNKLSKFRGFYQASKKHLENSGYKEDDAKREIADVLSSLKQIISGDLKSSVTFSVLHEMITANILKLKPTEVSNFDLRDKDSFSKSPKIHFNKGNLMITFFFTDSLLENEHKEVLEKSGFKVIH